MQKVEKMSLDNFWPAIEPGTGEPVFDNKPETPEQLFDDVRKFLERFIAYPSSDCVIAHALWIAHTYCVMSFDSSPRLAFLSNDPACGKTRAMEITAALVCRPDSSISISPAALFRALSDAETKPTILIDEADTIFNKHGSAGTEQLRAVINAGHRKGASVPRIDTSSKKNVREVFPVYCAMALAGLYDLPLTVMSRSVVIRMKRRRQDQKIEGYRRRRVEPETQALTNRLAAFAESIKDVVGDYYPELPESITDRDADVWECLIAIADRIGGKWPQLARDAAVSLTEKAKDKTASLGIKLLGDIMQVWGDDLAIITTTELLTRLNDLESSPWSNYKGEGLKAQTLSNKLSLYDIKPGQHRINGIENPVRGYIRQDFADAWARYLPLIKPETPPQTNCVVCGEPLNPVIVKDGFNTHPNCDRVTGVTPVTAFESV